MKKILLLVCSLSAMLTATAQSERLAMIQADGHDDFEQFFYREDGKLDYIFHVEQWLDDFVYQRRIVYNSKGQILRDEMWQDLQGEWTDFTLVNYCEYTYDSKGNVATRDNYNRAGEPELSWSARITYYYDENNRLSKSYTYWSSDLNTPWAKTEYTYDAKGNLSAMAAYQKNPYANNALQQQSGIYYYYNADNTLNYYYQVTVSYGEEIPTNACWFYYDKNKDLTKVELIGNTGDIHDRAVFYYDTDVPGSELFIPCTHEYEVECGEYFNHKRTKQEVWVFDEFTNELVYTHDKIYSYEPTGKESAIHNVMNDRNLQMSYSASDKSIRLSNKFYADVTVSDMSGRVVLNTTANGGRVDLSSLPKGNYVVSASQMAASPVVQKINIR